jgi:hypothetical protein
VKDEAGDRRNMSPMADELRVVGATLDEITYAFVDGPRAGECVVAELPPVVLLPPGPTAAQVVAESVERSERR